MMNPKLYLMLLICGGLACSSCSSRSSNTKQIASPSTTDGTTLQESIQETGEHTRLYPLFKNCKGWVRSRPIGRSIAAVGGVMASCRYRRDNQHFTVHLMVGALAQAKLTAAQRFEQTHTDPQQAQTYPIQGFEALLYGHPSQGDTWTLVSRLHPNNPAVLSITFAGIASPECLKLAQQFDWASMAAVTNQIHPKKPKLGSGLPGDL